MKLAPGSWTVKPQKDGGYLLRGVRLDGSPVRLKCATRGEGERLAGDLFRPVTTVVEPGPGAVAGSPSRPDIDPEWGLPRVSAQTVASVAASLGRGPAPAEQAKDTPAKDAPKVVAATEEQKKKAEADAEIQKRRRKYASSFSELLGAGYAMGVGIVARKTRDPERYEIARPSPKHLTDLADCTAEGIKESFGDMEIGPWTMCGMLTVGIIVSTWMQSTRKKEPGRVNLHSVPNPAPAQ